MCEKKNHFSTLVQLLLIFTLIFSISSLISSDLTHYSSYDNAFAFAPTPLSNQTTNNTSTIAHANHPPVANAGINQIVNENEIVILNGIASDPDPNDKLTYFWNQTAGPPVKLGNNTSTNPSFTAPKVISDKELRFLLMARDDNGAENKNVATVTILVKHVNRIPIAVAGADLIVDAGDIVTLDAGKSSDPDNDPLKYFWAQISGPNVTLSSDDKSIVTITAPTNITADTNLVFKITVKDNKNAIDSDDTKVTIKYIPPPNKPPIANAGTDQTVDAEKTVQLDGSKSTDADGNITSYSWSQLIGQPVALNANNTSKPSFEAPSNTSATTALVFQLTTTDEDNATDISTAKITVKPANRAPVADAGINQTVSAGDIATLDGSESNDPDGNLLRYSWKQTDGSSVKLKGADKPIATFTAPTNISADTDLIFELTVTDDEDATSTASSQVTVKYIPPPNEAPVANAGNNQTVDVGADVTLDGSTSSDPEGGPLTHSWIQTGGPPAKLNGTDIPILSFTAPTDITVNTDLHFKLTITDDKGSTSYDDVKVTVKYIPPMAPPEQTSIIGNQSGAISTNETTSTGQPIDYQSVREWGSEGTREGNFDYPNGIAVDALAFVYVVDSGNQRVQKFDSNGNFITKWGSNGTGDGQFASPEDVAVDTSGNVYVTDSGNQRVQKFDSNGNFITKWGSNGTGDGQFLIDQYDIGGPNGIAVDSSGNVYVTDSSNGRIQKFDSDGNFITKWGSYGQGDGQFNTPESVAVDSSDNVYVADFGNSRIQKFDSDGNFITKWGSEGIRDKQFDGPEAVAIDSSDNVYVAEKGNDRIQKFDSEGNFITKWGSYGQGDGQFRSPIGVAIDSSDNVYVVDPDNEVVQKFDSTGNFITKWGSEGTGDGQFDDIWGIDIDSSNNVYIADEGNSRIQVFAPSTNASR